MRTETEVIVKLDELKNEEITIIKEGFLYGDFELIENSRQQEILKWMLGGEE
jgi:hypothetical protein